MESGEVPRCFYPSVCGALRAGTVHERVRRRVGLSTIEGGERCAAVGPKRRVVEQELCHARLACEVDHGRPVSRLREPSVHQRACLVPDGMADCVPHRPIEGHCGCDWESELGGRVRVADSARGFAPPVVVREPQGRVGAAARVEAADLFREREARDGIGDALIDRFGVVAPRLLCVRPALVLRAGGTATVSKRPIHCGRTGEHGAGCEGAGVRAHQAGVDERFSAASGAFARAVATAPSVHCSHESEEHRALHHRSAWCVSACLSGDGRATPDLSRLTPEGLSTSRVSTLAQSRETAVRAAAGCVLRA